MKKSTNKLQLNEQNKVMVRQCNYLTYNKHTRPLKQARK